LTPGKSKTIITYAKTNKGGAAMSGKLKTALLVAVTVIALGVLVAVGIGTSLRAAEEEGDERRNAIKNTFLQNVQIYDDVFEDLKRYTPQSVSYVIIANGTEDAEVKMQYDDVETNADEKTVSLLTEFADITGCSAIYSDGRALFVKIEFASDAKTVSEANFIRSLSGGAPQAEGCEQISGEWYYAEYKVE